MAGMLDAFQAKGGGGAFFEQYGWLGILVLILDILVIVFVLQSRKRFLVKLVWIAVIVFLPILGLILYFLLGREKG